MKQRGKRGFISEAALILAFILWTILIQTVDVQPVGVNGTSVGFAAVNTWFHRLTGVHMGLYTITDWLGLVPIAVCIGFGLLGGHGYPAAGWVLHPGHSGVPDL